VEAGTTSLDQGFTSKRSSRTPSCAQRTSKKVDPKTAALHLAKLELAGLVRADRQGKRQIYVATNPQVLAMIRLGLGGRLEASQQRGQAQHA